MDQENQSERDNNRQTEINREELLKQGVQLLRFLGRVMTVVGEQIQKIDEQDIKRFSASRMQDVFREKE